MRIHLLSALVSALALTSTAVAAPALAASPKEMAEVAAMVLDEKVPALLRKKNYINGEFMGTTMVFVHKGLRYTLYHSGEPIKAGEPQSAWLSVWVQKNGTYAQKDVDTFSDHGFDGTIDFGISGSADKRMFRIEYKEGLEHREYWQRRLDAAITAAREYKSRFKKK